MAYNQDIPIGRVVNVSIEGVPVGLSRTNMNIVCLVTSEKGFLNSSKRTVAYTELTGIASDFGTFSKTYQMAKYLFGPANPISKGGGYLVVGYWRAIEEIVEATAGYLKSAELSEAQVVGNLQTVKDGSFVININNAETPLTVTNINFTTATSLDDVVAILQAKITGVTVTKNGLNQIIITSSTTGTASNVTYMDNHTSGTNISDILCLSLGSGAVSVNGKAIETLDAETKEDAILSISSEEPIRGGVFI